MSEDTITQPELLKLLSGEISFDAWLEKQDGDQSKQVSTKSTNLAEEHSANPLNLHTFDGHETEDSSIFSSWGNAFTSKSYTEPCTSESIPVLESEQLDETPTEESDVYDEEDEDNFYQPEDSNTDNKAITSSSNTASTKDIFKLPSFESVPPFDENDNVIQGFALVPVIEKLCELVKTSTVRSKFEREKKKPSKNQFEEIPDIMKDFQAFQLRKRSSNFTRNKLPELLRMQMGQANLLVAKGDFKQAADICMEIVREAPYSGQPFKTLSFIYDEQGDKEMSLQM